MADAKPLLLPTLIVFVVAVLSVVLMVLYVPVEDSFLPSAPDGQLLLGAVTGNEYLSPIDPMTGKAFFSVESEGVAPSGSLPLTVKVDADDGTRIFYEKFYVSTKNDEWEQYEFGDAQHGWVLEDATEDVIHPASLVGDEAYVIVFSCEAANGEWKCGCDANDNCNKWAIVNVPLDDEGCVADTDCAGDDVCDTSSSECVPCVVDSDCESDEVCEENECEESETSESCTSNADCQNSSMSYYDPELPYCRVVAGECVECKQDAHCTDATKPVCNTASWTCEAAGGTTTGLSLTGDATVYSANTIYDCSQAHSSSYGPAASELLVHSGAMFTNDNIGIWKFTPNKLQQLTTADNDLFVGGRNYENYDIDANPPTVSNQIEYTSDQGSCSPRFYKLNYAGDGELYGITNGLTTHPNSFLFFDQTNLPLEIAPMHHDASTTFITTRGTGTAIVGSFTSGSDHGNYVFFWKADSKRYGLYKPQSASHASLEQYQLVDLSTPTAPTSLGALSAKPELRKVLEAVFCKRNIPGASDSCSVGEQTRYLSGEHLAIVKDAGQMKLYDYSDPLNLEVLDTFATGATIDFEGPINGIRDRADGAFIDGNTLYFYIAGGQTNDAPMRLVKDTLNPAQLAKCWYDSSTGPQPCYYGQLWKHAIGSSTKWQKVMDVPGTTFQMKDGLLFMLGSGTGTAPYDPSTLYEHHYGTRTYSTNVPNKPVMWVYDIESGEAILKADLPYPSDATLPPLFFGTTPFGLFKQNGNYYAYVFFDGRIGHADKFYVQGYEFTPT